MNKVILIGRLTRNPETRVTQSGKSVTTFTLAVDRKSAKDGNGPKVDFIPIVAWEKLAELTGNNLSKGRRISIEGNMQVRSYEGQDGIKRYVTEVVAREVEFLDSKNSQGQGTTEPPSDCGAGGFGTPVDDEEIPF